jgi:CO/xanthine dehydrogenase FAD-binding subunit
MKPFDYMVPHSLGEATSALHEHGETARLIAGGTDVLIELRRSDAITPEALIDISRLQELKGITSSRGTIELGPLTTHAEVCASTIIREQAPLLRAATITIGSPQIRNRGTVGGNIMNAATCADTVPPLIALNARVTLHSVDGNRECDLAELFVKPYRNIAHADEMLTVIRFSPLPVNGRSAFVKLGRRNAVAISRLSVAAIIVRDDGGIITDARLVPGAIFPTWKRVTEAERMLVGNMPSAELFRAAGNKVSEVMISYTGRRWSTEYKEPVLSVIVRRALEICCAATGEGGLQDSYKGAKR